MNRLGLAWGRGLPAVTLLVATVTVGAGTGGDLANDEQALLKEVGLSASDLVKIGHGEIVGRTTDADSSAVALVVAGPVAVPPAFYIEKLRAIESFKTSPEILQIGQLGPSPAASDLARMTLDGADVEDLKECRAHRCGVKLDGDGIARVARGDLQPATASAAMRDFLADYARKYLQTGNSGLIEYRDGSRPRRLADELQLIVEHFGYLQRRWPSLYTAVSNYSGTLPEGLTGFVYWSKEKVGPRPVVSMTHVLITPLNHGTAAIASKQIFASHYSYASVGLTMLIDKGTAEAPRTLVIYVNRSRLDIFDGLFGGLKRSLVRSRARDGAERTMRRLRDRLEQSYRDSRPR